MYVYRRKSEEFRLGRIQFMIVFVLVLSGEEAVVVQRVGGPAIVASAIE